MKKKLTASLTPSYFQRSNSSYPDNFSIWLLTDRNEYPLNEPTRILVGINGTSLNDTDDVAFSPFVQKVTVEIRPEIQIM